MKLKKILCEQLYPIAQFKDCNKGSIIERVKSYEYNQSQANLLEIPILNWIIINLVLLVSIYYIEPYKNHALFFLFYAAMGIIFTCSFIVTFMFNVMYLHFLCIDIKWEKPQED